MDKYSLMHRIFEAGGPLGFSGEHYYPRTPDNYVDIDWFWQDGWDGEDIDEPILAYVIMKDIIDRGEELTILRDGTTYRVGTDENSSGSLSDVLMREWLRLFGNNRV